MLAYFEDSYEKSRAAFRALAARALPGRPAPVLRRLAVASPGDPDLTIDLCELPPAGEKKALVMLSSGLHGVEGFAGAAFQRLVLDRLAGRAELRGLGFFLLHAINPFGFKYARRATEFNIDLNRNFGATRELFATVNSGYRKLAAVLAPARPVSAQDLDFEDFTARAADWQKDFSRRELTEAIVRGQYEFPAGIYFGGRDFAEQRTLLEEPLRAAMDGYREILAVDLHSGYGRHGRLHLFPEVDPAERAIRARIESLFAGTPIDWGGSDDFYSTTGEFVNYLPALRPPGAQFTPMIFEYGTLDSQEPAGALRSVRNMILENQNHFHGAEDEAIDRAVRSDFQEMFFPTESAWRASILEQSERVLTAALRRLTDAGAADAQAG